jgi:hypothetical protein
MWAQPDREPTNKSVAARFITVTIVDPVAPFALALKVTVPAVTPVTRPAAETVATDGFSLDQVRVGVLTVPDPSLTAAVRGTLPPIATVAGAIVIVYVTAGGGGGGGGGGAVESPPPQALSRSAVAASEILCLSRFIGTPGQRKLSSNTHFGQRSTTRRHLPEADYPAGRQSFGAPRAHFCSAYCRISTIRARNGRK